MTPILVKMPGLLYNESVTYNFILLFLLISFHFLNLKIRAYFLYNQENKS